MEYRAELEKLYKIAVEQKDTELALGILVKWQDSANLQKPTTGLGVIQKHADETAKKVA